MIKKLIIAFLGLILLMSTTTISVIFVARETFSKNTFTKIVDIIIENNKDITMDVLEDENQVLKELLENEEIKAEYIDIIRQTYLFTFGVPDVEKPTTDKLKHLLEEYYNDKVQINDYNIDSLLNTITSLEMNFSESTKELTEIRTIMEYIYNKEIFNIILLIIGLSILFIYLLKRDLLSTFKSIALTATLNGIGILSLGYALNLVMSSITTKTTTLIEIAEIIGKLFYRVGGASLISGIILYIIISIVKKRFIQENNGLKNTLTSDKNNKNPLFS